MKKISFSTTLPEALYKQLKKKKEEEGVSITFQIEQAVKEFLGKKISKPE